MEITFETLKEANSLIEPIEVKGKEYAEVKERVKAFRYLYPMGNIETEIITYNKEEIVIRARAWNEQGKPLATGYARGKSNKFFALEDTETSAVGRCLGFCGLGITTAIASAEEVQDAQPQEIFDEPIGNLKELADKFRAIYPAKEQARILNGLNLKKAEDIGIVDLQKYIAFKEQENAKEQSSQS